jgi:ketosteroid isomerase-like protein
MADRTPEDVFKSQFEAYVLGDLDAFIDHWAPDCTFHDITEAEPRKGHEQLREYMATYRQSMTDIETQMTTLFGSGDRALAELVMSCTWLGEGAGPGGTPVMLNFCVVDVVRDGLVQTETVYWDSQQLANQLGASRQPGKNADAVRVAYNAMDHGDMGPYFALFDDEAEFREPGSLPYGGTYHGHDGLQRLVGVIGELWDETHFEIDELLEAGDYVVVVARVRSRSRNTGDEVDQPIVEVLRFRNGKIISAQAQTDTARFLQALGLAATATT